MSTIRVFKSATGNKVTGYQVIIRLPRSGERLTRKFTTKKEAQNYQRTMDARVLHLEQKLHLEGRPDEPITRAMAAPERYAEELPGDQITLGEFAENEYHQWREVHGVAKCPTRAKQVAWWVNELGPDLPISQVNSKMISKALLKFAEGTVTRGKNIGKQRTGDTVDRQKSAISSMMSAAQELMLFEGPNPAHGLRKYQNQKDWQMRMQQFFDHYLIDAPAPVWLAEGVPAVKKGKTLGLEYVGEQPDSTRRLIP